jgi:hypothetical protein
MEKKTETEGMIYGIRWDESEGIIRAKVCCGLNERQARELQEESLRWLEERQSKARILVLVDLTQAQTPSFGARQVIAELLASEKRLRCAFFGLDTYGQMLVSFIVRAAGASSNTSAFKEEAEALRWLRQ